jgi:rod shape-determining protein MreD
MMAFRTVQPLSPFEWVLPPAAICVVATLVLSLPIKVFGLQLPEPVFAMAPAFAWAVIRPSILPPFVLTGLGLFQDVLWGGPLGLWPLCLLTLYGLAFSVRRVLASEGFWALGAWFAAICAVSFAVGLLLTAFVSGEVPSLLGVAMQFAPTIALFPLAWLLVERFEDADVRFR